MYTLFLHSQDTDQARCFLSYFQNGVLSAIPFLCMYITGVSAGQLADWLRFNKILPTGEVRKVFATAG